MREVLRYTAVPKYNIYRKLEKDEQPNYDGDCCHGFATTIMINKTTPLLETTEYVDFNDTVEDFAEEEEITKEEWVKHLNELVDLMK